MVMVISGIVSLLIYIFTLQYLGVVCSATKLQSVRVGHSYEKNDPVDIIVNTVGPYNNPLESYRFYSLPFCKEHHDTKDFKPDANSTGGISYSQSMGQNMAGYRLESSPYAVKFDVGFNDRVLCKVILDQERLVKFREAILYSSYFEIYVEDLPMWGYIGDIIDDGEAYDERIYLFTHHHFRFGMHNKKIVSASIGTDVTKKVDITSNAQKVVEFTYSVDFYPETLEWKDRLARYTQTYTHPTSVSQWLCILWHALIFA